MEVTLEITNLGFFILLSSMSWVYTVTNGNGKGWWDISLFFLFYLGVIYKVEIKLLEKYVLRRNKITLKRRVW